MGYHRIFKPVHSCAISWNQGQLCSKCGTTWSSSLKSIRLYFWAAFHLPLVLPTVSRAGVPQNSPSPRTALSQDGSGYPRTLEWSISQKSSNFIQVFKEQQLINSIHLNIRMINNYLTLQKLYVFLDSLITDPWNLFCMERKWVTRKVTHWQACSSHWNALDLFCSLSSCLHCWVCSFFPNSRLFPAWCFW